MSEDFVSRNEFNNLKNEVQELKEEVTEYRSLLQQIDKKIDVIGVNDILIKGQISQNGEPTPATPQEIHCVKGNNVVKVTNQNLFDESEEYPINLGSLELCKIGDYQDYIYKKDNKWYKHKAINKNTLNDNEKWHFGKTKTNYTILFTSSFQNDIKIPANNDINSNTLIYCDKFSNNTTAGQQWLNDTMSSVTINKGKNITFNIPNSIATTTDEFKTYLISNNITLYYVLATPIEEEIIDTTLISQLEAIYNAPLYEQTNITQTNNDLPMVLDITACKDNIKGIKAFIRKER